MSREWTIAGGLQKSARQFPQRLAIVHGDLRVTYSELWTRAIEFATFLRSQGLRSAECVALILENSVEYIVAYYGAMLAGAIAVPLNAAARSHELSVWLNHSGARWAFISSAHPDVEDIQATCGKHIRTKRVGGSDQLPALAASAAFELPVLDVRQPACILYTSGTSGAPKGVVLTHAALFANAHAIVRYLNLQPMDSIVCVLPFYYSYGSSVLHTHLNTGACLVIEPNFVYPQAVVATIAKRHATGFAGVPQTYAMLLHRTNMGSFDLSTLRYVTAAGGPMSTALIQRLRHALPHAQLFIMYGQTEATARLTYLPPERIDEKAGSVGIPLEGVSLEVRSEHGAICGPGESGEVWVKGPNVMAGYWRDPHATAEVLRDGWLRTGDIGHLDSEAYLFLAGRRSDIIKTIGHRIHPSSIEEVIQQFEGVGEVAVVGVEDEMLGQAIKAFIVPMPNRQIDTTSVKAYCRERLATYKIPKQVEIVDALPRTPSGKVRRHELQQRSK